MSEEEWRDIATHPGYQVSSLGRVRSERKVLSLSTYRNGYQKITLGSKGGTHLVHTLVAKTFLGDPMPGYEVAHWNNCRADNRVANLRWTTRADNFKDKRRHGTNGRKFTEDQVKEIRTAYATGDVTQTELAAIFNTTQGTIGKIVRNEIWRTDG